MDDAPRYEDSENHRILVVDDNVLIHDDFRKILTAAVETPDDLRELSAALFDDEEPDDHPTRPICEAVYEVHAESTGQAALAALLAAGEKGRPFALAFVDVRMSPGWDGIETTRRLWDADPELHVVLCTAHSDYSFADITRQLPQPDRLLVLKKPFEAIEVRQLACALAAKWRISRQAQRYADELKQRMEERTGDLQSATAHLHDEMQERTRVEAELDRARRIETLGKIAAAMRHEINTPLCYVMANLEFVQGVLADGGSPSGNAEALGALDDALTGVKRISQILRDVMLFSRHEHETGEAVDLGDAVKRSLKIVNNEIRHRANVMTAIDAVPSVVGGQARLEQVLVNLLINAAQSIPEGQAADNTIGISGTTDQHGRVLVEISDTGKGIGENEIDQVFDPLYTTKGEGTGLGLTICRSIIESFGGQISIRSEVNRGTTVALQLQATEDQPRECLDWSDATPAQCAPMRRHILLVDDNEVLRRALCRHLPAHEITPALTGHEALHAFASGSYDFMLCDLMMPDVTGMDVFEQVAKLHPGMEDRIGFMTAGAFTPRAAAFLQSLPVDRWIRKPFTSSELRVFVERRLAQIGQCDQAVSPA